MTTNETTIWIKTVPLEVTLVLLQPPLIALYIGV
jgi:hypothetical protein